MTAIGRSTAGQSFAAFAVRGLTRLERHLDLRARLVVVSVACQREDAIGRVPELGDRAGEVLALFGGAGTDADLVLPLDGVVEVRPDPLELRGPRTDRIGGLAVQHVAHGQAQLIEVVLNPQELQGVAAIAVRQFPLEVAEAGDLARQLPPPRLPGSPDELKVRVRAGPTGWPGHPVGQPGPGSARGVADRRMAGR